MKDLGEFFSPRYRYIPLFSPQYRLCEEFLQATDDRTVEQCNASGAHTIELELTDSSLTSVCNLLLSLAAPCVSFDARSQKMTVTLAGSSRELKHKRFLPPIDLVNDVPGVNPSAAPTAPLPSKLDAQDPHRTTNYYNKNPNPPQNRWSRGASFRNPSKIAMLPRSISSGDGLAKDLSPVAALVRGSKRMTTTAISRDAHRTKLPEQTIGAAVGKVPTLPISEHAFTKVPEKSPRRAVSQAKCMNSPDHDPDDGLRSRAVRSGRYTVRDWGEKREGSAVPSGKKGAAADAAVWDSDRFCVSARGPLRSRELTPCYARATSCGSRRSCRRGRSRWRSGGISVLVGVESQTPRLCPTLEARILDLRQDNTAVARFLEKTQQTVASLKAARRPMRALVFRNRVLCALERAEFSSLRREESVARAQRRQEGNRERRRQMDRRRSAIVKEMRAKLEGPSRAEMRARARELSELLEQRQRFFLFVVATVSVTVKWQNDWNERRVLIAKIAEAIAAGTIGKFERCVMRVQHLFRKWRGGTTNCGDDAGGLEIQPRTNYVRRLQRWIRKVEVRWKRRRQWGGAIIHEFLREARLTQNINAIYRFRRRVIRCQIYVKGYFKVTRARLVLLNLYYRRCEERLRGRMAERVRQQVKGEADGDREIHCQMRPRPIVQADRRKGGGKAGARPTAGGAGRDKTDLKLMEFLVEMRLKSALEELEARVAHPAVKRCLLDGLLVKVRAEHQANIRLAYEQHKTRDHGGGGSRRAAKDRSQRRQSQDNSLAEAVFTVDDARKMLSDPPPTRPVSSAADEADDTISKQKRRLLQQVSVGGSCADDSSPVTTTANTAGSSTGAVCSSGGTGTTGSGGEGKPEAAVAITSTRVEPVLLLRAITESAMCKVVLTAWERSSTGGSSCRDLVEARESRSMESGGREAPHAT